MAGYSQKSLKEKLGLTPDKIYAIFHAPEGYEKLLGAPILDEKKENLDFIQYFTRSRNRLIEDFPKLKQMLKKAGMLWISWPKSSCSFATSDLTENTVRDIGLEAGLVDVKVAAIDEDWSGIKFVYRLKDR